MNNNEPLDNVNFKDITAQEIIEQLKNAGFNEVYEIKNGGVQVKGLGYITCEVKKNKQGNWQPSASVEMVSLPVIIPAFILVVICQIFKLGGALPMTVCAMLGYGIGNLVMSDKKAEVEGRLLETLKKNNN